ncbi:MAG: antitoxin [Mycobacteriales bacterium]|nr:MAG: kanamycin biosynthetic protein [Pseudonocardiales bacterium]
MGLMDKVKGLVKGREDQVRTAASKVGGAVGKAGDFVDDKTKGKYHDKINTATQKTGEALQTAAEKVTEPEPPPAGEPGAPPPVLPSA